MPFFLLAIKQKKRHCPSSCCKNALKLSRISHEKTERLRIDVGISSSACKAKNLKIPTVVQFKEEIVLFWTKFYKSFSVYTSIKQAKKGGQPFSVKTFIQ